MYEADNSEQIIEVEIADLQPHPKQSSFFLELNEIELAELAEDIGYRGLQTPISILRDGTIVCGHQRVAAAKLMGWDTIDAYVLDADGTLEDFEVLDCLIVDNTVGRNNDPLTLARCYANLESRWETDYAGSDGEKRDVLAEKLGCGYSGRTLDRLKRLLHLPRDIQDLISRGQMNRLQGEKLLRLADATQELAYERLRNGEPPKSVLNDLSPRRDTSGPEQVLRQVLSGCDKIGNDVLSFAKLQVGNGDVHTQLENAISALTELRDQKQSLRDKSIQDLRDAV